VIRSGDVSWSTAYVFPSPSLKGEKCILCLMLLLVLLVVIVVAVSVVIKIDIHVLSDIKFVLINAVFLYK
jgi:hypothetical protein